jgi:hypothetical protein
MFLDSTNYLIALDRLVSDAKSIDMAVAFWGKGAEELLKNRSKRRTRVICNLTSGGTNTDVIKNIQAIVGVEVRHLPNLHAKVILGDKRAILGSANCSANGLNLEGGEVKDWQEAGYVISSMTEIDQIRDWYSKRWTDAQAVTPELLDQARKIWKPRRKSRIATGNDKRSLLSMSPASLEGRNIVVAIYRAKPSLEALKVVDERKREENDEALTRSWTFYEDWSLEELEKGMIVIDVYIGAKGGVTIGGPYKIFAVTKSLRKEKHCKGEMMTLHYANPVSELIGVSPKLALAGIKERVRSIAFDLLPEGADSKVIPVEVFVTLI